MTKDLGSIIADAINEINIEEIVKEEVQSSIKDALRSSFSYGEGREIIKKTIENSIINIKDKLEPMQYQQVIEQVLLNSLKDELSFKSATLNSIRDIATKHPHQQGRTLTLADKLIKAYKSYVDSVEDLDASEIELDENGNFTDILCQLNFDYDDSELDEAIEKGTYCFVHGDLHLFSKELDELDYNADGKYDISIKLSAYLQKEQVNQLANNEIDIYDKSIGWKITGINGWSLYSSDDLLVKELNAFQVLALMAQANKEDLVLRDLDIEDDTVMEFWISLDREPDWTVS